jgi:hypothetical protein
MAYSDDVNLLGDDVNESTETLIDTSKEVGPEIRMDQTEYMLFLYQHAGQNQDIKMSNRSC